MWEGDFDTAILWNTVPDIECCCGNHLRLLRRYLRHTQDAGRWVSIADRSSAWALVNDDKPNFSEHNQIEVVEELAAFYMLVHDACCVCLHLCRFQLSDVRAELYYDREATNVGKVGQHAILDGALKESLIGIVDVMLLVGLQLDDPLVDTVLASEVRLIVYLLGNSHYVGTQRLLAPALSRLQVGVLFREEYFRRLPPSQCGDFDSCGTMILITVSRRSLSLQGRAAYNYLQDFERFRSENY